MTDAKGFFEDMGLTDADDLNLKVQAAMVVAKGIAERGLTQAEFGKTIGWKQPTVSALVRGELDLFSWKRLNEALAPFGKAIKTRHELVDAA